MAAQQNRLPLPRTGQSWLMTSTLACPSTRLAPMKAFPLACTASSEVRKPPEYMPCWPAQSTTALRQAHSRRSPWASHAGQRQQSLQAVACSLHKDACEGFHLATRRAGCPSWRAPGRTDWPGCPESRSPWLSRPTCQHTLPSSVRLSVTRFSGSHNCQLMGWL